MKAFVVLLLTMLVALSCTPMPEAKPLPTVVIPQATVDAIIAEMLAVDFDCQDFPTQWEAQRFFIRNGGPGYDPHYLDGDNDGRACEMLP